jgi:Tfp pilus assembly protein PilF
MRRAFVCSSFALAFLLIAVGCGSGGDLTKPETQREFGVRMAKMNLWREAMFRFRREVQISPDNAMAHNNLAVALEANGDFDAAAKEYREALRLDRSNEYIQKNYSRFVEFTQKAKKREAAAPKPAATATATTTGETPAPPATDTVTTDTTATTTAPPAQPPPTPATTTNPPDGGVR